MERAQDVITDGATSDRGEGARDVTSGDALLARRRALARTS